jgi:hypothetical protein
MATLLPFLEDPDSDVRRAAARSLGQLGNPGAGAALASALTRPGQSLLVRRAAAAALVRVASPDAQPQLLSALSMLILRFAPTRHTRWVKSARSRRSLHSGRSRGIAHLCSEARSATLHVRRWRCLNDAAVAVGSCTRAEWKIRCEHSDLSPGRPATAFADRRRVLA